MDGEMFGKKEMDEILSFRKVVDWAIMSESASDMGATPLHSFASLVDKAIGSIKVIAEANLRASPCPVHDFASAVDIRTKNSVEPKAAVNNFAGGGTIDGSGVTIRRSQSWPKGKTEIMFDFDFCLSNVSSSAGYRCTCEKFMSDLNSLSNVGSSARYGCSFKERYDESPYHPHAFQFHDIPETLMGSGTIEGEGCPKKQPNDTFTKVTTGGGGGWIPMLIRSSWLYLSQKRKLLKKEKYFEQNGGMLLKQQLSQKQDLTQSFKIFTRNELMKATHNFSENLIISIGHSSLIFKGCLGDNRMVAIKKVNNVVGTQVQQFVNEVMVLSQINHRNIVKFLGCCLETNIPLLVYEFVNNGTLFDYLHNEKHATKESWKTRLRIAREIVSALSYLHSQASTPIIHRDVKTSNILLDDTCTAKVSDFGISRFFSLDQTEITTIVQGTLGYLDPEYFYTSHLTEKSDVYSFGVVLLELLTGKKPISFDRDEENRNLATYFLHSLKEDRLFEVFQIGILDEENKQEIKEVAILAAKCLSLIGRERPRMKEVELELERISLMKKYHSINIDKNVFETQYLFHEESFKVYELDDSGNHQYA